MGSTCRTPKTDFEKQLCLHVDDTLFQDEIKFTIKCNVALFYLLEVAYRKQVNHIHFWGTAGVRVLAAPSAVPGHQSPGGAEMGISPNQERGSHTPVTCVLTGTPGRSRGWRSVGAPVQEGMGSSDRRGHPECGRG